MEIREERDNNYSLTANKSKSEANIIFHYLLLFKTTFAIYLLRDHKSANNLLRRFFESSRDFAALLTIKYKINGKYLISNVTQQMSYWNH